MSGILIAVLHFSPYLANAIFNVESTHQTVIPAQA